MLDDGVDIFEGFSDGFLPKWGVNHFKDTRTDDNTVKSEVEEIWYLFKSLASDLLKDDSK